MVILPQEGFKMGLRHAVFAMAAEAIVGGTAKNCTINRIRSLEESDLGKANGHGS